MTNGYLEEEEKIVYVKIYSMKAALKISTVGDNPFSFWNPCKRRRLIRAQNLKNL